jgi:hypothetical protein
VACLRGTLVHLVFARCQMRISNFYNLFRVFVLLLMIINRFVDFFRQKSVQNKMMPPALKCVLRTTPKSMHAWREDVVFSKQWASSRGKLASSVRLRWWCRPRFSLKATST